MNDIFASIYNKVLGFFKQTEKEENAKDIACNRLRVVLMQDRTNLTPELMERMRNELIELLSRYVEMDKEALELNFGQEGDQMALMLSIPVLRAKDEAEIEKTLAELDAKKSEEKEDNESKTDKDDVINEDEKTESETKDESEEEIEINEPEPEENSNSAMEEKIEIVEEITPKEQKIAELSVEDIVEPTKDESKSVSKKKTSKS